LGGLADESEEMTLVGIVNRLVLHVADRSFAMRIGRGCLAGIVEDSDLTVVLALLDAEQSQPGMVPVQHGTGHVKNHAPNAAIWIL
jgi:hypothetical protein